MLRRWFPIHILLFLTCCFGHQPSLRRPSAEIKARQESGHTKHGRARGGRAQTRADAPGLVEKDAAQKQPQDEALRVMRETGAAGSEGKAAGNSPRMGANKLIMAYGAACVAMTIVVFFMFYPMGLHVVFQVVLYVACLAFVKIALKFVYERDFNYPKFITAVHLLLSSSAAFVVLLHRKYTSGKPLPYPSMRELAFGILPIAATFGFSIASENSALVFVSAAFSEVVASTNPVMSFLLTWAFGMGCEVKMLPPIAVVVFGCLISVKGEMHFSGLGLVLLLLSVFFRGLKAVMQQKLMTGETKEKFDPPTLMAWTCLFAFLVVAAYSVATEGGAPFAALATSADLFGLLTAIFVSAAIACTLNISALFVIKQLGAVGMQMVSQTKAILVVVGGIALLGESFTTLQQCGFVIALSGVFWYSRVQRGLPGGAKGH